MTFDRVEGAKQIIFVKCKLVYVCKKFRVAATTCFMSQKCRMWYMDRGKGQTRYMVRTVRTGPQTRSIVCADVRTCRPYMCIKKMLKLTPDWRELVWTPRCGLKAKCFTFIYCRDKWSANSVCYTAFIKIVYGWRIQLWKGEGARRILKFTDFEIYYNKS